MKKHVYTAFMKIAEPRHIRLMQFGIYILLVWAGVDICLEAPPSLHGAIGGLVYMFASFLMLGSLLAAFAVLPGIWWLERVGLILLGTSMIMYFVMVISLGATKVAVAVSAAFVLTFIQRWTEIKGSQLAPKEESTHARKNHA